jgi:hypothetical protein
MRSAVCCTGGPHVRGFALHRRLHRREWPLPRRERGRGATGRRDPRLAGDLLRRDQRRDVQRPAPNFWSGEGEADLYDQPLDPVKIEKLGRHDLAVQVMRAREAGVDAYGWLPNEAGGKGLLAYADRVGADLVLLPATDEDDMAPYVDELRSATTDASKPLTAQVQLVDAESQVTPI